MLRIARQTVVDQKRSFLFWSLGLLGLVLLTVAFYPSIKGQESLNDLTKDLPDYLKAIIGEEDLTSPVGYLNSQLFQTMLPALFLVFAIGRGTSWTAGDEREGSLEMLLANPVSRSRVVFEKGVAVAASVFGLGLVLFVALVAGAAAVNLGIDAERLGAVCLALTLLGTAFGLIGVLLGAATGNKGLSAGVTSAIAVAGFLLAALAPAVDSLEPFEKASPFYYYLASKPLMNGIDPIHMFILLGIAVLSALLGARLIGRRDLAA